MCHFITATLPSSARIDEVREIASKFRRAWRPIDSGPVVDQLEAGETYYLTTLDHCDCGTALGSAAKAEPAEVQHAAKIKRLKRKGWSEAKIERWLSDKEAAAERRHHAAWTSGTPDAESWLKLLRAVVASEATSKVGLLLHFYAGGIADAEFEFGREPVSLSTITAEFLLKIEEDRLYEFYS